MKKNILIKALTILFSIIATTRFYAAPESGQKTGTAGTYPLGGSDYVNLYNGHLNFTVPLLSVNGRGGSGVTVPLTIGSDVWSKFIYSHPNYLYASTQGFTDECNTAYEYTSVTVDGQTETQASPVRQCHPVPTFGNAQVYVGDSKFNFAYLLNQCLPPAYAPGALCATYDRHTDVIYAGGFGSNANIPNAGAGRTTLTFVLPDGSSHSFVDTQTMGRYQYWSVVNGQVVNSSRGKNFTATDGSSMTFISDTVINDTGAPNGDTTQPAFSYPTGYILMKNGSRYRIEQGLIKWTKDINGNKTLFQYVDAQNQFGKQLSTIVDSLGRQVNINYDINDGTLAPDGTQLGIHDEIHYPSIGGADQKIVITKDDLANSLRSGYTVKHKNELWPDAASSTDLFNKTVIASVWLPTGQPYKFKYNSFGELAKVDFPSGAGTEYDYDYASNTYFPSGQVAYSSFRRRVVEARLYSESENPGSLVTKTAFSNIYSLRLTGDYSPITTLPVQVDVKDASDNLLSRSKHYFRGDPTNSTNQNGFERARGLEDPLSGREIKTEIINPVTQAVYQRTEYSWQMRVPGYSPSCTPTQVCNYPDTDYLPARDPILTETKATLRPDISGGLVTKTSAVNPANGSIGIDNHNNQTDAWQYDGGVGNVASLPTRHRHMDFLSVNPSNGVDYANPASGTDYVLTDLHMRGLPSGEQLYAINPSTGAETL
ncbi:MAG: hypothetical protein ABI999_17695, partial [Acidobacteriota bacterium]